MNWHETNYEQGKKRILYLDLIINLQIVLDENKVLGFLNYITGKITSNTSVSHIVELQAIFLLFMYAAIFFSVSCFSRIWVVILTESCCISSDMPAYLATGLQSEDI